MMHNSYNINHSQISGIFHTDDSTYVNDDIAMHLHDEEGDLHDAYNEITLEEEHDTPPLNQWYHGKLDRGIAEERLLNAGHPGGYLVRESERKPGSYVLSFYSVTGITHFRIIAVCGEFYIGGRQFPSLSHLIAFYTFKSCLLQDEVLDRPAPPPEPVNDKRRVKAIFPYQSVPDGSDELSFEKNEVFVVQNEMEGEWLWVTSLRTNESGCVFKGLVQDVGDNVDPHEGKEWFHSIITKDQAYDLLMTVDRPGGFLIRPSDSTPGDYVLFFFTGQSIQRFKIHRKNYNQFEMGGRLYISIDDIVEHYKSEQIVCGQKLSQAVPQTTNLSRVCENDIYQTIQRENQQGLRSVFNNSSVVKRGQLYKKGTGKRGYDHKKWKQMHFVLDGEKQHFYFFEHDRKTKPKGLVDLSYGAVYPVHDSYFGRPHCFQIVVRALNETTSQYFCADTLESAQDWFRLLRANCAKPNRQPLSNPRRARQVRSLSITVDSAHKLLGKGAMRLHCAIDLNTVHVGRTTIKDGNNPVWGEDFLFDDLPPDVDSFTLIVHNTAKRSKNTAMGDVHVHFRKLTPGKIVDEWYNVQQMSGGGSMSGMAPANGTLGSIRIRARYSNELIMPVDEYKPLKDNLLGDIRVVFALSQVCGQDRSVLASVLLKIYRHDKLETELLCALNEREISTAESDPATLFRATTLASTLMEQYMRSTCASFVNLALKDVVKQITEDKQSCELNPAKLSEADNIAENRKCLLNHLQGALASIRRSQSIFPKELRYVFGQLQKLVFKRWPNDPYVRTRVVSGFIFLRLLVPAIINPKMFNMNTEPLSMASRRNLLLVAKTMQNLANLVEFGSKECYMESINSFIIENKDNIVQFIDALGSKGTQLSSSKPSFPSTSKVDLSRDLALLHQICVEHFTELQSLSSKEPSLKTLLGVIELLNQQIASYMQKLREE